MSDTKLNGAKVSQFFANRIKNCPICQMPVHIEEKDGLGAFVCAEGSPCRAAPVYVTFPLSERAVAVRWFNQRAPIPCELPAGCEDAVTRLGRMMTEAFGRANTPQGDAAMLDWATLIFERKALHKAVNPIVPKAPEEKS